MRESSRKMDGMDWIFFYFLFFHFSFPILGWGKFKVHFHKQIFGFVSINRHSGNVLVLFFPFRMVLILFNFFPGKWEFCCLIFVLDSQTERQPESVGETDRQTNDWIDKLIVLEIFNLHFMHPTLNLNEI